MSFVTHLMCRSCGATYAADRVMNLCERDGRPVEMVYDLPRLLREHGRDGWRDPRRRDMWRFGALLPLNPGAAADRPAVVTLGEGSTPEVPLEHPLARAAGFHLFVKDEGRHYLGHGANPTLSFKDRGMAVTVSMARASGLTHLAVPTQGNAGDALARYAVAAGVRASVVMPLSTDRPVMGGVAALAKLHPELVELELVEGTIVDCGRVVTEQIVPAGAFNVATFREPGWRIEGKKTLGLEMAEPREAGQAWSVPDVIVYPTGGGTGVLGMAKAFDELEGLGLVGDRRPRMICVQSAATAPLARAFESDAADVTHEPAGSTIATGLNVAHNVGHVHVLRIVRESGGAVLTVTDEVIRRVIRDEWNARRFAWCPEGAATLAVLPELIERRLIQPRDRVVVVNTASAEKYLPAIRDELGGGL